ncbi:SH3 domain-containing protein [Chloroflexota bacterium]
MPRKNHPGLLLLLLTTLAALIGCNLPVSVGPAYNPQATAEVHGLTPIVTETPPVEYIVITATPILKHPSITPVIPASPTALSLSPMAPQPSATLPAPAVIIPTTARPFSNAAVCTVCGDLRLRVTAGTAGQIITTLDADLPLVIVGRTADSVWLQVRTPAAEVGWVAREYVQTALDLNTLPITGTALNLPTPLPPPTAPPALAPAAPTSPDGIPIVTGITANARQIYLVGRERGNLPHVVSKIGDSITFSPAYLRQLGADYNLGQYSYLQPVVDFFTGPTGRGENSFAAASVSAVPGWTTADVLSPGGAPAPPCSPDEPPLLCEYRTARPSIALIMLGTVDSEGKITLTQYRANLQRIIEITIGQGIVPVLSTIPPMQIEPSRDARASQINQIIIETARSYDIPLWNYYAAMTGLPNQGLSSDGGHPSEAPDGKHAYFDAEHLQYGYTMRNLTALQVLYELWQQLFFDVAGGAAPPPPTAAPPVPTAVPPIPAAAQNVDSTAYTCPGAPPLRLTVGGQGRVTPGLPNRVRTEPALGAAVVGRLDGDTVFAVQGGPKCVDGYTWWYISGNGVTGWTASGNMAEYWVLPYP